MRVFEAENLETQHANGFSLSPHVTELPQVAHELDWPFTIPFAQIVSSAQPIGLPKAVQCNNGTQFKFYSPIT